jgi:hypothetical protein
MYRTQFQLEVRSKLSIWYELNIFILMFNYGLLKRF